MSERTSRVKLDFLRERTMDETLRLFIAIDLPPEVKQVLRQLQTQLRRHTNAVRWADPEGTHLTLKFLGAVPALDVSRITDGLRRAALQNSNFTLQTAALGMFPNDKRPRVVWLGMDGDVRSLHRLQAAVEQWIAPLGYPTEQRPFSPHLTLGRTIKDPSLEQLRSISHAVAQTAVPVAVTFSVSDVTLMRSELRREGARYTAVERIALDGQDEIGIMPRLM